MMTNARYVYVIQNIMNNQFVSWTTVTGFTKSIVKCEHFTTRRVARNDLVPARKEAPRNAIFWIRRVQIYYEFCETP